MMINIILSRTEHFIKKLKYVPYDNNYFIACEIHQN